MYAPGLIGFLPAGGGPLPRGAGDIDRICGPRAGDIGRPPIPGDIGRPIPGDIGRPCGGGPRIAGDIGRPLGRGGPGGPIAGLIGRGPWPGAGRGFEGLAARQVRGTTPC